MVNPYAMVPNQINRLGQGLGYILRSEAQSRVNEGELGLRMAKTKHDISSSNELMDMRRAAHDIETRRNKLLLKEAERKEADLGRIIIPDQTALEDRFGPRSEGVRRLIKSQYPGKVKTNEDGNEVYSLTKRDWQNFQVGIDKKLKRPEGNDVDALTQYFWDTAENAQEAMLAWQGVGNQEAVKILNQRYTGALNGLTQLAKHQDKNVAAVKQTTDGTYVAVMQDGTEKELKAKGPISFDDKKAEHERKKRADRWDEYEGRFKDDTMGWAEDAPSFEEYLNTTKVSSGGTTSEQPTGEPPKEPGMYINRTTGEKMIVKDDGTVEYPEVGPRQQDEPAESPAVGKEDIDEDEAADIVSKVTGLDKGQVVQSWVESRQASGKMAREDTINFIKAVGRALNWPIQKIEKAVKDAKEALGYSMQQLREG